MSIGLLRSRRITESSRVPVRAQPQPWRSIVFSSRISTAPSLSKKSTYRYAPVNDPWFRTRGDAIRFYRIFLQHSVKEQLELQRDPVSREIVDAAYRWVAQV